MRRVSRGCTPARDGRNRVPRMSSSRTSICLRDGNSPLRSPKHPRSKVTIATKPGRETHRSGLAPPHSGRPQGRPLSPRRDLGSIEPGLRPVPAFCREARSRLAPEPSCWRPASSSRDLGADGTMSRFASLTHTGKGYLTRPAQTTTASLGTSPTRHSGPDLAASDLRLSYPARGWSMQPHCISTAARCCPPRAERQRKSTLLRVLARLDRPDHGDHTRR